MALFIEVIRPDGGTEKHNLSAERTTLGRAPEATISLPDIIELEEQHLLFMQQEDGNMWVSAVRDCATPVMLDGKPFENGALSPETELDIGSLTIAIRSTAKAKDPDSGKRNMRRVFILGLAGAFVWMTTKQRAEAPIPLPPEEAPILFDADELSLPQCSITGPGALREGRSKIASAKSRWHRYHFDPQEGIKAVGLYQEAEACLKVGQASLPELQDVRRIRDTVVEKMEDEYRQRKFNLAEMLKKEEFGSANDELNFLRALIAHRGGPYSEWLVKVQRRVLLKLDNEASK